MENEFDYYIIEPVITERTPLLMSAGAGPNGIDFLYLNTPVRNDHVAHLRFLMNLKNPDMDVDYLFLDTFAVFSERVCEALRPYLPIKNFQLVKAIIYDDNAKEYSGFSIAGISRVIQSFDQEKGKYKKINKHGNWIGIKKIVLDKELLTQIPLEERIVFKAKEDVGLKLYHRSIVDIIKSVNPKGLRFIPVAKWSRAMTY